MRRANGTKSTGRDGKDGMAKVSFVNITIRIEPELRDRLSLAAEATDRSVSRYIRRALKRAVEDDLAVRTTVAAAKIEATTKRARG